YDTLAAARAVASEIGPGVRSVRLDSGDLVELSKQVREILDAAGMQETQIFASGDMNEYRIADIIQRGGQIDGFGVGTEMVTSYDAPALNSVYKLVSLYEDGRETMRVKLSPDKLTYPGAKQVWRFTDDRRESKGDVISLAGEEQPHNILNGTARPLLEKVMIGGRRLDVCSSSIDAAGRAQVLLRARALAEREVAALPKELRGITPPPGKSTEPYAVRFSEKLERSRENAATLLK
ncbi:MAG: hypothetical protein ACREAC_18620, partial [Blastocatellia bacterium]